MADEGRDFAHPVAPEHRPRKRRATVRVLVLDLDDRVLLFEAVDPGNGVRWWETPGGGVDPGESELDAVVRELAEETGQLIEPAVVLGPVARRRVVHGYSDVVVEQDDTFYAIRGPAFTVDTAGFTDLERLMTLGDRWWPTHEIATTQEQVWPADLLALVALLETPERWPLALEPVEESSVPI